METLSAQIGTRIRQARERLGLTQEDLGRRLAAITGEHRFSTTLISLLESGRRPIKVEDILSFVKALEVTPSFLLGETLVSEPSANHVRQVFLRAARFLHPGVRSQLEDFIEQVEAGPRSPAPVLRVSTTTRAAELVRAAGYTAPPIDPADVAQKVGLRVVYLDLDADISGVIVLAGSRRVIGVNGNQMTQRQRFSIAHEVAHYIKGHSTTIDIDVTNREWFTETGVNAIEERQADAFAAEMLMPSEWVEKDSRVFGGDHEALATRYGASKQAMWIRLMELGLAPEGFQF